MTSLDGFQSKTIQLSFKCLKSQYADFFEINDQKSKEQKKSKPLIEKKEKRSNRNKSNMDNNKFEENNLNKKT